MQSSLPEGNEHIFLYILNRSPMELPKLWPIGELMLQTYHIFHKHQISRISNYRKENWLLKIQQFS